jgi:hypothetical protein
MKYCHHFQGNETESTNYLPGMLALNQTEHLAWLVHRQEQPSCPNPLTPKPTPLLSVW